jgi:putative endonuclease
VTGLFGGPPRSASLGRRGERLAARWLKRRGFRILFRNLRSGREEADLVAVDPDGRTLVIVEVKTRRSDAPGPEASLDDRKGDRLARLAARLARRREYRDHPVRLDAVAIVWPDKGRPTVRHHPGAF